MPIPHAWFREGGARKAKEGGGRERKAKEKREKGGLELNFQGTRGTSQGPGTGPLREATACSESI